MQRPVDNPLYSKATRREAFQTAILFAVGLLATACIRPSSSTAARRSSPDNDVTLATGRFYETLVTDLPIRAPNEPDWQRGRLRISWIQGLFEPNSVTLHLVTNQIYIDHSTGPRGPKISVAYLVDKHERSITGQTKPASVKERPLEDYTPNSSPGMGKLAVLEIQSSATLAAIDRIRKGDFRLLIGLVKRSETEHPTRNITPRLAFYVPAVS